MKKNFTILLVTLVMIAFVSCERDDNIIVPDDVINGVTINGVRWATRNVGPSGTFAHAPESMGNRFQWNRGDTDWTQGWYGMHAAEWEKENDPCPQGWRVPTITELQSLENAGSQWVNVNGVYGRLFGTAPNQLFLPAAGRRFHSSGARDNVGTVGFYWSSTTYSATSGWHLRFSSNTSNLFSYALRNGLSVRCVSE